MKLSLTALAVLSTLAATEASAQYADLTGRYRCVQLCRDGAPLPAFVTQNGRELNLVNEAGEPSRAWIDGLATSGPKTGSRARSIRPTAW
jgi:hypothetical protein